MVCLCWAALLALFAPAVTGSDLLVPDPVQVLGGLATERSMGPAWATQQGRVLISENSGLTALFSFLPRWLEMLMVYPRTNKQNQKKKRKVEPPTPQVGRAFARWPLPNRAGKWEGLGTQPKPGGWRKESGQG